MARRLTLQNLPRDSLAERLDCASREAALVLTLSTEIQGGNLSGSPALPASASVSAYNCHIATLKTVLIQYFVGPPLAAITAKQRSLILPVYFSNSSGSSFSHSSSAYCRTSSFVVGNRRYILPFNSLQTFLIGFKSGEFVGYSIISIPFYS